MISRSDPRPRFDVYAALHANDSLDLMLRDVEANDEPSAIRIAWGAPAEGERFVVVGLGQATVWRAGRYGRLRRRVTRPC